MANPKAWRNLSLGFGLVSVKVSIGAAVPDSDKIKGTTLDAETLRPVGMSWVDKETGEVSKEQVIGYEHNGEYVVLKDKLDVDGPDDIELEYCVPANSIDQMHYEKCYLIWAQKGGEKAFDLFATALRQTDRMAIGKVALTNKTRLVAIRWSDEHETLLCHILVFNEAINHHALNLIREEAAKRPKPDKEQLNLAKQVVGTLSDDLDFAAFTDTYQAALRDAIESGGKVKPEEKVEPAKYPDITEALRASLKGQKTTKKAKVKA